MARRYCETEDVSPGQRSLCCPNQAMSARSLVCFPRLSLRRKRDSRERLLVVYNQWSELYSSLAQKLPT